MVIAAGHEYVGSVWVSEGKLYERQPDGSVQCWTDEPGLHSPDPVETLELTDSLTCDVQRYQVLEAYINCEPLAVWMNNHESATGSGPTEPPPSIDPESIKVHPDIPVPKLALVQWVWSQDGGERGRYQTFEDARESAEETAERTKLVCIAIFAGLDEIEKVDFKWTDQDKLTPA
jgi:hypothetical protein